MTIVAKKALIQWISFVNNPAIINQIFEFKVIKNDNFHASIKKAMNTEQLKEETTAYIKSLDWEK
jgi:hypothetical protein